MHRTIQILTSLALFAVLSCLAQDEAPTAVTPQNRAGDLPFSSVVGTGIEHVEATTGNLVIDIPILDLPGRGMNYSFHVKWDARFWVAATRGGSQPFEMWNIEERGYLPQFNNGLWSTNMPRISYVSYTKICNTNDPDALNHVYPGNVHGTGNYIYHDASGAKHPIMVGYESAECEIGSYTVNNSRGPALSGSGLIVTLNPLGGGGINSTYFSDGTTGTIGGFASVVNISSSQSENDVGLPTYQDVYGNAKSEIPGGADTVGRGMLSRTDTTNQTVFTVFDSNGTARTYTVNYVDLAISTNFNMASIYGGLVREYAGTRKAISSIVLPNSRSYSFLYDNYGYVTRIAFPTGAIIDYTWANDGPPERVRYVASRKVTVNGQSNT
jgi:hypothetical protein